MYSAHPRPLLFGALLGSAIVLYTGSLEMWNLVGGFWLGVVATAAAYRTELVAGSGKMEETE